MYCDSKAAIAISCNPIQHSRTKHIDVRYHFIKEKVKKGIVELFFFRTEYQLADLFTKALSVESWNEVVIPSSDPEIEQFAIKDELGFVIHLEFGYINLRALRDPKINYTSMEKLVLALVHASKHLKRYFQAHPIIVITDQPIQQVLSRLEVAGRLQKWSIELGEYTIHYRHRVSVKGQILADFIVKRPEEDSLDTLMEVEEELPKSWILFTDRSSCTDGSGA
nr:reverse transcriptase domain-containing protein [Tanacetum cinerariifolium]